LYDYRQFLLLFAKQTNPNPVRQEVNGTVILPPLVFPADALAYSGTKKKKSLIRLAPAELKDDFRRAVVTRRYDRRVVLPLERRRPEVDQLDSGVAHASHRLLDDASGRR
jgi:hypothetical protein